MGGIESTLRSRNTICVKDHSFLKQCLHDLQLTQFGGTFTKPFSWCQMRLPWKVWWHIDFEIRSHEFACNISVYPFKFIRWKFCEYIYNLCLRCQRIPEIVFCYQNCSDLLWEIIVLVIEKNFWNSRLKAENLQKFWDH